MRYWRPVPHKDPKGLLLSFLRAPKLDLVDGSPVNHLAAYVGLACDFDTELHALRYCLVKGIPGSADTQHTRPGTPGRRNQRDSTTVPNWNVVSHSYRGLNRRSWSGTLRSAKAGIGTQAFGAPEADVAISPHRHHTTNVRLSKLAVTLGGYAGQCCPPIVSIKASQPIVSR